jgi:PAS domain S-box-containing protein
MSPYVAAENAAFRDLLEAAPDAMLVVGNDGKILLVNRQAERIFGYSRGELLGQALEMLVPERFRAAHKEHRAAYGAAPRLRAMGAGVALRAVRKNTSEFDAEISLSPVESPDGDRVIVAIRDVTDRKRLEDLTRLREDLMRRVASRGGADGDIDAPQGRVLKWRALELDPVQRRVFVSGGEVRLRRLEYRLIATFLEYPKRVFTRDELLFIVWGLVREAGVKRTVDTHVRRLRERLGEHGDAIETVHGVGYRLRGA